MKMTSRIYGIAVKETVDYYEYDDIKLQFNQDTKHWSVFSNYDNVWFNGTQYTKGSLILMFSDYAIAEYAIMAQYTDTTPYTNYIYRIVTNAKVNPASLQNGRIEYIFEADPEEEPYTFTCKMVVNNVQQKKFTVTDVDIKTYKNQNNGKLPKLFTDLKMDWHGMNPEAPYLPYSFTIIANSDYIKDGVTEVPKGEIVLQIPAGVGQGSYYHRILDETNIHEVKPEPGELPSVIMYKKIGRYNARPSVTFTRETIIRKVYHDHTKVYYNGHYHKAMYLVVDSPGSNVGCWKKVIKGLNFTYADPFWFCMTSATGIEMNGHVYGTKQLVKCWKDTDPVNMVLTKTTSRKKAAPENAPYDDIIYDVVSNETNVTVTRIRRKTHIDTSGHKTTEDIQEGLPIVFDTSNSPVLCWNIEFKAKNNVWTIYSKCGYIRYGGRQYPKNRSILDFNAGEEMHIEIKDETEKYEVQEILTYRISNVTATAFMYKVWTVGTSYTIKVEKSIPGQDPEPWVTINFYDAIYESVVVDDIQIDFDNSKRIWILSSASDNLYSYDKKIDKGEVIAEWGLNTVFSMKDDRAINVILPNSEMDVRVRVESNLTDLKGIDVSDFLPKDLGESSYMDILVTHSVNKGLWVVTSKNDNTYVGGTRYTYNKEIFSCYDKQGMSEIDIMCQHKKDESGQPISPYINWHYFISIYYDTYEQRGTMLIDCKKQATPPQTGWVTVFSQTYYTKEKEDAQDQRKNNIILTKQNAKSMYGYIWKRDMPGPVPPPVPGYIFVIAYCRFNRLSSYSTYAYETFMGFKNQALRRLQNYRVYVSYIYFYTQKKNSNYYFIKLCQNYNDSSYLIYCTTDGDIRGIYFDRYEIPLKIINDSDIVCLALNSSSTGIVSEIRIYRIFENQKVLLGSVAINSSITNFVRACNWNSLYWTNIDGFDYLYNSLTKKFRIIPYNNIIKEYSAPPAGIYASAYIEIDTDNFSINENVDSRFDDLLQELTDTYDSSTYHEGAREWEEHFWTADDIVDASQQMSQLANRKHSFKTIFPSVLKDENEGFVYLYFFLRIMRKRYYDYGQSYSYGMDHNYRVSCVKYDASSGTRTIILDMEDESNYENFLRNSYYNISYDNFIKYNGNYYKAIANSTSRYFRIVKLDISTNLLSIEKEVDLQSNPDYHIEIPIYGSNNRLKLYFDSRAWSKANLEVGLFTMHFQRQCLNGVYYYCFHIDPSMDTNKPSSYDPQAYSMYVLLDNPLMNASNNNLAFFENTAP